MVVVVGFVLVCQRFGLVKGVIFLMLEDEGGIVNIIVWLKVFEKYCLLILGVWFLKVSGCVQNEFGVIYVVVEYVEDVIVFFSDLLDKLLNDVGFVWVDEVKWFVIEMIEKIKLVS